MRWLIRTFFRGVRLVLGPFMLLWEAASRPEPIRRPPEAQAEVDRACGDLALYQFPTCPFCIKVRKEMHRLALPIELRDARNDPDHRAALEAGGGRIKVPCLRVPEGDAERWIYESDAVIDYLRARFAA